MLVFMNLFIHADNISWAHIKARHSHRHWWYKDKQGFFSVLCKRGIKRNHYNTLSTEYFQIKHKSPKYQSLWYPSFSILLLWFRGLHAFYLSFSQQSSTVIFLKLKSNNALDWCKHSNYSPSLRKRPYKSH